MTLFISQQFFYFNSMHITILFLLQHNLYYVTIIINSLTDSRKFIVVIPVQDP